MFQCRKESLILHPFERKVIYSDENGSIEEHRCPECGLTKTMYFCESGFLLNSEVVEYQKLPSIMLNRFEHYMEWRNGRKG